MHFSIRPARLSDQAAIKEFTTDTFDWGDYIADVLPDWVSDPLGQVMVATDESDHAVAVGRGLMLSEDEAWLQGARVSQQWRRRGIASAVGESIFAWSLTRGAKVARLAVEEWNAPAQKQVEAIGFRNVARWVVASRSVAASSPAIPTNGGQRSKARRKLEQAPSSEGVPAWVSWRSGPLVRPARGLRASHWRWSQLRLNHLEQAGKGGELWSSQAGWAWVERDGDQIRVGWVECGPDDGMDMVRSLVDLAIASGAEAVQITIPAVPWLEEAVQSLSFELSTMLVYEKPS